MYCTSYLVDFHILVRGFMAYMALELILYICNCSGSTGETVVPKEQPEISSAMLVSCGGTAATCGQSPFGLLELSGLLL